MTSTSAVPRIPNQAEASTAEFALLGSCLIGDEAANSYVMSEVTEDFFVDLKNRMLFKALQRMYRAGVGIDMTTVVDHLTPHEKKLIPISYISQLTEKVSTTANVRHYSNIARNRAITVQLNKAYEKVAADPWNDETRKEIARLWDRLDNSGHSVISLKDATIKYADTIERRRSGREFRLLSGYANLDKLIGGFYGGNLIAVGARTSLGKTSLLLNFALRFLQHKLRVLFVSAEMITDEILDRMVAMDANLPISQLRKGHVYDADLRRMNDNLARFHELPMWFLEGGKMSMSRLRHAVDAINPSVVFVDFIQRFVPPNPAMNRAAYFSDLVNEFKTLALNKKLVLFAASQLSRDIEKEGSRAPQLSDFKESGGIEEAADVACLLQADKKGDTVEQKRITLHVCKHRSGPTGRVAFIFKKARTMFFEEEEGELPMGNP